MELPLKQLAFAQLKNRTKSAPNLSSNRTTPSISRNKSPKPKTIESTSSDSTTNTVSSSVRSENLREIWKLLDENEHDENNEDDEDEIRPTRDKTKPVSANQLKVTGVRPPSVTTAKTVSLKSPKITPQRSTTPNNRNTAPKIRNYNIKD